MQLSVNVRKMQQKIKNIWIVEFFEFFEEAYLKHKKWRN